MGLPLAAHGALRAPDAQRAVVDATDGTRRAPRLRLRGSSLIEAMVSASLLIIGLTAVVATLAQVADGVRGLRLGTVAGAVLRDAVEDELLRADRTAGSDTRLFDGGGRPVTDAAAATITVVVTRELHASVPGLLVVTSTATWDDGRRRLSLVTMRG